MPQDAEKAKGSRRCSERAIGEPSKKEESRCGRATGLWSRARSGAECRKLEVQPYLKELPTDGQESCGGDESCQFG